MLFEKKEIKSFSTIEFDLSGMRFVHEYLVECNGDTSEIIDRDSYYEGTEHKYRVRQTVTCPTSEIIDMLNRCNVLRWDGFHGKHPKGVLDGIMFRLKATVNEDKTVNADGSQNFPKNFDIMRDFFYHKMKE